MLTLPRFLVPTLLAALLPFAGTAGQPPAPPRSIEQLNQRLADIDSELSQLAATSMRSGVGTVGYRSMPHEQPGTVEWIQVDLGGDQSIDQIVLVPTIWRDTQTGFQADGFPLEFELIVGSHLASSGTVVATFSESDALLPRIAPLVVSIPPTTASWVQLRVTALSRRAWDERHILQLAELLVFSGEENVALRRPVLASSQGEVEGSRIIESLVDGFVPYLMDAAQGEQSIAMVTPLLTEKPPVIVIDLGAAFPLNRVHWHAPELSDTVPQSTEPGFGIPRSLLLEGANQPDFSDALPLVETHMSSIFDTGPIIMRRFTEATCRYVRMTAPEPDLLNASIVGFAEIELFADGRNVALGRPAEGNFRLSSDRFLAALTDGRNLYGEILTTRDWMNQLARRHDLEAERPRVAAELARRYERQRTTVSLLTWIAVLLAVGIAFTILVNRMLRSRQLTEIRERFAADLHDELGANIHTIGLLSDVALSSMDSPERLANVLRHSRDLTQRTGTAIRHCINLQKANGLYDSLPGNMRRAAQRIMADLEHELTIENEAFFDTLTLRAKTDLFLFYKECLVNISRHAEATRFQTRLTADGKHIRLSVRDNGLGTSEVPSSLRRRARLLRATVSATVPQGGGTCITLTLRIRKRLLNRGDSAAAILQHVEIATENSHKEGTS